MKRIVVCGSGGGTTARAIIEASRFGDLPDVTVGLIIASKPDAGILRHAQEFTIPTLVLSRKQFDSPEDYVAAFMKACPPADFDGIGLHGWLPLVPQEIIEAFPQRIWNQHPGPVDPIWAPHHFGGKGWYGIRVHAARLNFVRATGWRDMTTRVVCQFVDTEFDQGAVFGEAIVPIEKTDTPEVLQQRCLPIEHQVQIRAINDWAHGRITPITRDGPIVLERERPLLARSIEAAIRDYP